MSLEMRLWTSSTQMNLYNMMSQCPWQDDVLMRYQILPAWAGCVCCCPGWAVPGTFLTVGAHLQVLMGSVGLRSHPVAISHSLPLARSGAANWSAQWAPVGQVSLGGQSCDCRGVISPCIKVEGIKHFLTSGSA